MAANDDKVLTLEAIDEIKAWGEDSFAAKSAATQSADGLMNAADKTKLDGITAGAQPHQAPTSSEITGALGYVPAAAYSDATDSSAGLMSAADKTNLDELVAWQSGLVAADTNSY